MGFEMQSMPAINTDEEKKKSRLSGAVAGAVLSVGMMAGQAAEAQTAPNFENREQMEMVASGMLSQSNEVFTIEVKPGSAKPRADGKSSRFRDYGCENIRVKIASEEFKCDLATDMVFRGPQSLRVMLTVTNDKGREITFSFLKPSDIKGEMLRTYEVPSDQQGNPVFYSYGDTKFSQVDGGIKYNTVDISNGRTAPGVFKLEGVQLQGILAQYAASQKK